MVVLEYLYVCDRCGENDFPNGHALGDIKDIAENHNIIPVLRR